jgi:hypothetical protein
MFQREELQAWDMAVLKLNQHVNVAVRSEIIAQD